MRLLAVLREIGRHPFLGPRFHLRGGTAINLFLADAPRLSVDADLNYVGAEAREEMRRERPELMRRLREVVLSEDYALGRTGDDYALESQDFTYTTSMTRAPSWKTSS